MFEYLSQQLSTDMSQTQFDMMFVFPKKLLLQLRFGENLVWIKSNKFDAFKLKYF